MNEPSQSNGVPHPRLLHVTTVPQSLCFLGGHVDHTRRHGFDVHVLSSPGTMLDHFGKQRQVHVYPVVMPRRITPLRDLVALWRITRVLRRLRPDVVDGHTPKGGLLAMLGAWLCGVPVRVYHMYGLPQLTARGMKRRLLCWSEWLACALAHQVLCLSPSNREVAVQQGLCQAHKIKVLLSGNIEGVDAEKQFNPACLPAGSREEVRARHGIPADAQVMGFVGRIVRDKGLIELAAAWRLLREEFPTLHLLIVGPFEPQDPVPVAVTEQLRGDPRIHLAGVCQVMPPLYGAMDLLILPTYREGFGTVLLEAAAMTLPVVATRIPGCVDAVRDGETALLVPARDGAALAGAARTYLRDPELRRQHGLAGRTRVLRDFQPEAMHAALHEEYVRLLHSRGRVVQ